MNKRFLEHLLAKGFVEELQLRSAIARAKKSGTDLIEVLLRFRMLTESDLARALATFYRYPLVDLNAETPQEAALDTVDGDYARKNQVLPLSLDDNGQMRVAVADPARTLDAIEYLRRRTSTEPQIHVTERTALHQAVSYYYFGEMPNREVGTASDSASGLLPLPSEEALSAGTDSTESTTDTLGTAGESSRDGAHTNTSSPPPPDFGGSPLTPAAHKGNGLDVPSEDAATQIADLTSRLRRVEEALEHERRLLQSLMEVLIHSGLTTREELLKRIRSG